VQLTLLGGLIEPRIWGDHKLESLTKEMCG